jgi:hypothetical protein
MIPVLELTSVKVSSFGIPVGKEDIRAGIVYFFLRRQFIFSAIQDYVIVWTHGKGNIENERDNSHAS